MDEAQDGAEGPRPMPHQGRIDMDWCSATKAQILSHRVTKDCRRIEGYSSVAPVYDEDGMCVLMCMRAEEEAEFKYVDMELGYDVFTDAAGRWFLIKDGSRQRVYIEDKLESFIVSTVTAHCGDQGLACTLEAALMANPGYRLTRFRWSLNQIYTALGLSVMQGRRWD